MQNKKFSRDEILEFLKSGCSLLYFYLEGGVGVHDVSDNPIGGYCPTEIFLELHEKELIKKSGSRNTGYPHYANNHKYDIYTITDKGRLDV